MRYLGIVAAIAVCLAVAGTARATVTITFDPNDILDKYASDDTGLKASQPDARRWHAGWNDPYYGTFSDYMEAGHSQPTDYNTYVNWRNSLKNPGDGIAVFNAWFIDGAAARSWGENVVVKPLTTVSATAASGWNVAIIPNPYGIGGDIVQWYTLDPALRLRPTDLGGADIAPFSITADLYWDVGPAGWDPLDLAVTQDQVNQIRFWVGDLNGDDAETYRSDTKALYYTGANYGGTAGQYGSGFEAVLTPIPEPLTMAGLLLGIGSVVGYARKRRRA